MATNRTYIRKGLVLLATWAVLSPVLSVAQADDPSKYAQLKLEGNCDAVNNKLWLVNSNETKTMIVVVRWNLSGSKRIITDKFQISPSTRREIGCAAQADIVSVDFAPQ